ncbi:hypothetical protein GCM10010207_24850 [Streptomyces atratus]|nr:hypothetical protein GCM10010207_24850 [Streptomyces atratus]
MHVSRDSFSQGTSGHCKQDLCIRTPIFTSGKTVSRYEAPTATSQGADARGASCTQQSLLGDTMTQ